ncbi:MAG: arginine--tRNA ligase [Candidatus Berkiellales bacterium]
MLIKIVAENLADAIKKAFPQLDLTAHPVVVTRSTQANFGHYQCNSAMKLVKTLGMPSREIANQIVQALNNKDIFVKCEVAGPGFINITLSKQILTHICQEMLKSPKYAFATEHPQKIVIDYSGPNTAKEMHVGHLRSTIIGDSLARLFELMGHHVLRLSHVGDWGTQFGMLIAYIKLKDRALLDHNKTADIALLVAYYKAAKKLFDEDSDFRKASQLEVVALQGGNKDSLAAWQHICEISRKAYQAIYDLLDVHLVERGESFYNPLLSKLIQDLEQRGFITISEGAKCIFLEGFVNREGEPLPIMLQKSDGGFNYSTTDLAALHHRIEIEKADRVIYVHDAGQATHFNMLFKAAEKVGYVDPAKVRVDYVPFGLVLGPDGKKFKTRSGETERLIDLLTMAITKAEEILQKRNQEGGQNFSQDEIKTIAKILGINAIKYADLSCNRVNDYAFSYDRMLRFEGNTAAFLMYSFVRIQGIKRRVEHPQLAPIQLEHSTEETLGLHLAQFAEILSSISDDLMPNHLCEYLYELAEKFNAFFRDCRVEGDIMQNQRLSLCELTAVVLKEGLGILGLKTVNRM